MILGHNGYIWLSNISREGIIKEESEILPKQYDKI